MQKTHKLKIRRKYADAILSGKKTFEIRKDDRGYKVGDTVIFDPVLDEYGTAIYPHELTSKRYVITYVYADDDMQFLKPGYCVFAIAEVE